MRKYLCFLPWLMILLPLLLTGCPQILKPPVEDPNARLVLGRLTDQNKGLTQFKGLANVQMISDGQSQSGRIAFAAVRPDRMRVELLNAMGSAITSLAGNGKHISIFSHVDNKHYRIRQSRTALEPVIHLPIGIEDLQSLLSGGVPLPPHAIVQLKKTDGMQEVLFLKNRWHGLVSKLVVDPQTQRIQIMEVYAGDGELQYKITWQQWRKIGEFTLPSKVQIESLANRSLTLWVDRFWPNTEVPPSTFVLKSSPR